MMSILDGYIEKHVPNLSERHKHAIDNYKKAFQKVMFGIPIFKFECSDGTEIVGVRSLDRNLGQETIHWGDDDRHYSIRGPFSWRVFNPDKTTTFVVPLPQRSLSPLIIHNTYMGRHEVPPDKEPTVIKIIHIDRGVVASYEPESFKFTGSAEEWNKTMDGIL